MGCGSSKNSGDPEAEKIDWNNDASIDDEFKEEEEKVMTKRKVFDKTTKTTVEVDAPKHEREFDFFEGADAGAGEQFMAVRPYEGAIQEPEEHNEEKEDAPELGYELEYVYGYRAEDSRMNCFYNEDGNVVYFTAALGVILNKSDNTQKFFGGGQVDNTSKKVARDDLGHTNDITALDISEYGKFCATGQ